MRRRRFANATSVAENHATGKRTAEARRCPACGRTAALINEYDAHGRRICRWEASGKCPGTGATELAGKIDRLFEVMHKRDAPPMSTATAAAAITAKSGVPISAARLEALRSGDNDAAATNTELAAIATGFGVSPTYLTTVGPTPDIDAQLDLLQALRDASVQGLVRETRSET